jgi:hypothetical protein
LLASVVSIWGVSYKTTFNKELWTSSFPLYSIKPNLRNLFHEKPHARSGRADHLRQCFLSELAHDRLRPAFLAEICKEKEVVYGSLATSIAVLLSVEIGALVLLLGAQVIAEYDRIGREPIEAAAPSIRTEGSGEKAADG